MAYSDLNVEQAAQLDSWVRDARSWMGDLQRVINRGEALKDAYSGDDGVIQLWGVGVWSNTSPIPNTSGLAGAAPQQKLDVVQYVTQNMNKLLLDASTYTTGLNTAPLRQNRIAAAGPGSIYGNNSCYNSTTPFTSLSTPVNIKLADLTLSETPYSKYGSETFANRADYFAPRAEENAITLLQDGY